ncbi:MAG: HD domain-containing protein, partial [Candidatus Omnitrophota bacterium]
SVVREFAKKISSKCIVMDAEQESLRVVARKKPRIYTYDFTLMRGEDFYQDASLRDFSINTLAVNLCSARRSLIDYFGAKKDLKNKLIRVVKEEVIPGDPLRILRAFSFAAGYDFRIDPATLKLMVKEKKLLKKVSKERISEELFKVFRVKHSFAVIKEMSRLKILDEVIPHISGMRRIRQGGYHHLDVWDHSLETLRQFELLCSRRLSKNKDFQDYLDEELSFGRKRFQIIKLACLLHDAGKPLAKRKLNKRTVFHTHEKIGRDLAADASKSLRLSFREEDLLKKLIFWHLRPGYLADQVIPSQRAIYRFFRDTNKEGAGVVALSLADWRATRGPLTDALKRKRHEKIMLDLVKKHFIKQKSKPLPKLTDGYQLMKVFNLSSSPLIGKILKKIKEEQDLGVISTRSQALTQAKKIIKAYLYSQRAGKVS